MLRLGLNLPEVKARAERALDRSSAIFGTLHPRTVLPGYIQTKRDAQLWERCRTLRDIGRELYRWADWIEARHQTRGNAAPRIPRALLHVRPKKPRKPHHDTDRASISRSRL